MSSTLSPLLLPLDAVQHFSSSLTFLCTFTRYLCDYTQKDIPLLCRSSSHRQSLLIGDRGKMPALSSPYKASGEARTRSASPLPPPVPAKPIDLNSSTRSTDRETGAKISRRAFLCDVVIEREGEGTFRSVAGIMIETHDRDEHSATASRKTDGSSLNATCPGFLNITTASDTFEIVWSHGRRGERITSGMDPREACRDEPAIRKLDRRAGPNRAELSTANTSVEKGPSRPPLASIAELANR